MQLTISGLYFFKDSYNFPHYFAFLPTPGCLSDPGAVKIYILYIYINIQLKKVLFFFLLANSALLSVLPVTRKITKNLLIPPALNAASSLLSVFLMVKFLTARNSRFQARGSRRE